jgi:glycosyltransferase involved in cell wall biosynthesis
MFSALNCVLDTSNGAAISIRTLLRHLGLAGVECISLTTNVFDRPLPGSAADNLNSVGAERVAEPGYPQTLWLAVDGPGVRHYIVEGGGLVHATLSRDAEQTLYDRALNILDAFRPDILVVYGNRRYEQSMLRQARIRGIRTVFYLVHPGYKTAENFRHVDMVVTDTEATRNLYAERLGMDATVIGKFIDPPVGGIALRAPEYVTFVNPVAEKGVTIFLRIVELAAQVLPSARFLVVESRGTLAAAEKRTGLYVSPLRTVKRVGLQRSMADVFAATRVLLVPSMWHDSGPRVVVEAISLGIPTVVSSRGGIPELVGEAGIVIDAPPPLVKDHWLVPPVSDAIPWVEALRELLTDEATYARCRAAALERWQELDPAPRMPQLVALLQRLVDSPSHAE